MENSTKLQILSVGRVAVLDKDIVCCLRPKFAVIVVKKRINSRFFASGPRGINNPPPGTIVDEEATRPEW